LIVALSFGILALLELFNLLRYLHYVPEDSSPWLTILRLILVVVGVGAAMLVIRHEQAQHQHTMEEIQANMETKLVQAEQSAEKETARLKEIIEALEAEEDTLVVERALAWAVQRSGTQRGLLWLHGREDTPAVYGEVASVEAVAADLELHWPTLPAGPFVVTTSGPGDVSPSPNTFWAIPIAVGDRPLGCLLLDITDPPSEAQADLQFLADRLAHRLIARATLLPAPAEPAPPPIPLVAGILTPLQPALLDLLVRGRCSEEEALDYLQQIAGTLTQFHAQGVAFGLRPDDARVDAAQRKVYLSQHLDVLEHQRAFFEGLSAPELASNAPTPQSDVFGLGALAFAFYHRRLPRAGASLAALTDNMPPVSAALPGLDYVIRKALLPAPEQRFATAGDFLALLQKVRARDASLAAARDALTTVDVGADFNVGVRKGRNRGQYNVDNEDRLYWDQDDALGWAVLAIADGVSHADLGSGYRAAREFVEKAHQLWRQIGQSGSEPGDVIERVFRGANRGMVEVLQKLAREWRQPAPWRHAMSTAACLAFAHGRDVYLGNLGDVRAYLVGDGFAARLTCDGSRIAQAIADPAFDLQALGTLSDSELVEYVGQWEFRDDRQLEPLPVVPHQAQVQLLPGESVVLVSDGVYRYAREPDSLFEDLLMKILATAGDAQVAAFRLMASANQRGGGDNISCIVYRTHALPA
jgi:protein phosphatase